MKRVLITGAGRGVGLATVWRALEGGYSVRALARSAHKIELEHRALEKVSADATDADAVSEAVQDCEAVITSLGIGPTRQEVHLFSDAARVMISAMEKHGVKRLVAVTGLGAGDSNNVGGMLYRKILRPMLLGPIYADKNREEALIQASELDWTIVRPGILTRLPERKRYHVLVEPSEWRAGFITRTDCADFLVKTLENKELSGKTPIIIND